MADRDMVIEIVRGPEGDAIYLNDYRIAGPKPWGGGTVVRSWHIDSADVREASKKRRARTAVKAREVAP